MNTPKANRFHIGFFGRCNSGKSSLINALCGQEVSIVSPVRGTTTDPVLKALEIHSLGACVFIDTAGFDDASALGPKRLEKTLQAALKCDAALVLLSVGTLEEEANWILRLKQNNIPFICIISKSDMLSPQEIKQIQEKAQNLFNQTPLCASIKNKESLENIKNALLSLKSEDKKEIVPSRLAGKNDVVMLVMPQDRQAPEGRLILAQVQTLRELLDKGCLTISVTEKEIAPALAALKNPPKLIITDSQVFPAVYALKPAQSMLTSFSVLFAQAKGDIDYYLAGAQKITNLKQGDKVLIAECCTHAPIEEDIGRVKIPTLLKKKINPSLQIDITSGDDFPNDLTKYALIIQCGGCMFNRAHILKRIARAKAQNVPMTNYGVTLAALNGILDKVCH